MDSSSPTMPSFWIEFVRGLPVESGWSTLPSTERDTCNVLTVRAPRIHRSGDRLHPIKSHTSANVVSSCACRVLPVGHGSGRYRPVMTTTDGQLTHGVVPAVGQIHAHSFSIRTTTFPVQLIRRSCVLTSTSHAESGVSFRSAGS